MDLPVEQMCRSERRSTVRQRARLAFRAIADNRFGKREQANNLERINLELLLVNDQRKAARGCVRRGFSSLSAVAAVATGKRLPALEQVC
jgi:hypothetical protein